MPLQTAALLPGSQIPESHRSIVHAARREALSVRGYRDVPDRSRIAAQLDALLARGCFPQSDRPVPAPCKHGLAVRRKSNGPHSIVIAPLALSHEPEEFLPLQVPEDHWMVLVMHADRQRLAVWGEGSGVALPEPAQLFACLQVHQPDRSPPPGP